MILGIEAAALLVVKQRMGDPSTCRRPIWRRWLSSLVVWVLHTLASDGKLVSRVSLTTAMNAQREAWMRTMAEREIRIVDTAIMSGLQQGTAFFASSSLIALGGCFALLGASGSGSVGAERPASGRDIIPRGLSDEGVWAGADPGFFLLQVWLGLPAIQLLLDP